MSYDQRKRESLPPEKIEMVDVTPYFFVYGTLMREAFGIMGAEERRQLRAESTFVAAGTIPGRLFDLGNYPGLVLTPNARPLVHGEIIALSNPIQTLAWLDAYEGICSSPDKASGDQMDEYERVCCVVMTGIGKLIDAWVYVYAGVQQKSHRLLPAGRWTAENVR